MLFNFVYYFDVVVYGWFLKFLVCDVGVIYKEGDIEKVVVCL